MLNVFGYYENFFKWSNDKSNRFTANSHLPFNQLNDDPAYASFVQGHPGFGVADINEAGMKFYDPRARLHVKITPPLNIQAAFGPGWPGIFPALQHMLMGHPEAKYANNRPGLVWQVGDVEKRIHNEAFGGPVYYLPKAVSAAGGHLINQLSAPTNPYRYKVDLSEMKKLFEDSNVVPKGPLPNYYRVKASSMNLLELIDSVCKAANADFFVELLPDVDPLGNFTDKSMDGVIKIYVRLKQDKQDTTIIASYIRGAENSDSPLPNTNYALNNPHIPAGLPRAHEWYHRLVSHDIGKELPSNALGKVVMGAPKTRVVGVTELGVDFVREEYCACETDVGIPIPGFTAESTCKDPLQPPIPPSPHGGDPDNVWQCLREIQELDGVRAPNNYKDDGGGDVNDWMNKSYVHHRWNEAWRRFEPKFTDTNKRVEDNQLLNFGHLSDGRRFWDVVEGEWSYVKTDVENDNWNAESDFFRFNIHDGCTPLDDAGNIDFNGGETKPCGMFVNNADANVGGAGSPGSINPSFKEDHRIDIFPAWGFSPKYFQQTINGVSGPEDVSITNLRKGIKGEFDSMNPYWDWHALAGLPGIFEFIIYDLEDPKALEVLPGGGAAKVKAQIAAENTDVTGFTPVFDPNVTPTTEVFTSVQECVRYQCAKSKAETPSRMCKPEWQKNWLHPKLIHAKIETSTSAPEVVTLSEATIGVAAWQEAHAACRAEGVVRGISRLGLEKLRAEGAPPGLTDEDYNRIVTGASVFHDTGKCQVAINDATPVGTFAYGRDACEGQGGAGGFWAAESPQKARGATAYPRQIKRRGKFKEPCSKGRNIQIDMRDIGYRANDGIHLATVTELRHALIGQSEWMDYITRFDRQFSLDLHFDPKNKEGNAGNYIAETMGSTNPIGATAPAAGPAPGGTGGTSPVVLNANTGQGVLMNHVGADLDHKKKIHDRAYEIVKTVATDWYGKQFWVPLPYDPQMRTEYSKRTHGDDDGLIASFNVTNSWEIAEGGWVEPELSSRTGTVLGRQVFLPADQKDVKYPHDLSFWNDTGQLQPFLVYPYKVWQHIKEVKTEERIYLPDPLLGDPDGGCAKCDGGMWAGWNGETGNLSNMEVPVPPVLGAPGPPGWDELACRVYNESSVLNNNNADLNNICNLIAQDETFEQIKLEFAPLDFSELDRNSYYIEQERTDDIPGGAFCLDEALVGRGQCTNISAAAVGNPAPDPFDFLTPDGLWGVPANKKNTSKPSAWIENSAYLTRVWVKASVDRETYWMHSDIYRYGRIVPKSSSTGTCKDANGDPLPACAGDKDGCTKAVVDGGCAGTWEDGSCRGSKFGESADVNENVSEQNACSQLRPHALISTDGVVRYDKNSVIGPSAWTTGSAWIAVTMNVNGVQTGGALGEQTFSPAGSPSYGSAFSIYNAMAPAAYKPWDAAVPQVSNVESWGPWSAGDHIGKADFEEDTSLTPETFGSIKRMGDAGKAKVAAAASEFTEHERGTVTLWGLPEFPIGAPIVVNGPYVTNVTTDMSAGGINTTYRMETYKRQNPAQRDWWDADRDARVFRAGAGRLKSERDNIIRRNRPQTD